MHLPRSFAMLSALAVLAACDSEYNGIADIDPHPSFASLGAPGSVTGSGHIPFGSGQRVLTFHAQDGGNGAASGSYRVNLTAPGLFFEVDVTCVSLVANTAWVAGQISATNAPFIQVGSVSYFYAIDNGEGAGAAPDIVSTARINDVAGEDTRFCTERPLLLPSFPIEQGNVQVR